MADMELVVETYVDDEGVTHTRVHAPTAEAIIKVTEEDDDG